MLSDDYLIRFVDYADFVISPTGSLNSFWRVPGLSDATVETLYINQVLPFAQSRSGEIVLHASSIRLNTGSAVAFVGQSGAGKSTTAAYFSSNGDAFLTDDGLPISMIQGGYFAQPSHASIRLWEDSFQKVSPTGTIAPATDYTSKVRVLPNPALRHCDTPTPLRCIYILAAGACQDVGIHDVPQSEVMLQLVRHSFLLDVTDRHAISQHFSRVAALVRSVPVFRLDFPREYGVLSKVRETVKWHVEMELE